MTRPRPRTPRATPRPQLVQQRHGHPRPEQGPSSTLRETTGADGLSGYPNRDHQPQSRRSDTRGIPNSAQVNPSAVIGQNVTIGEHVRIQMLVRIGDGVAIRAGAMIGAGAEIGTGATIGAGAKVLAGVTVGPGVVVPAGKTVSPSSTAGARRLGGILTPTDHTFPAAGWSLPPPRPPGSGAGATSSSVRGGTSATSSSLRGVTGASSQSPPSDSYAELACSRCGVLVAVARTHQGPLCRGGHPRLSCPLNHSYPGLFTNLSDPGQHEP
jgi:hypothetical protein